MLPSVKPFIELLLILLTASRPLDILLCFQFLVHFVAGKRGNCAGYGIDCSYRKAPVNRRHHPVRTCIFIAYIPSHGCQ